MTYTCSLTGYDYFRFNRASHLFSQAPPNHLRLRIESMILRSFPIAIYLNKRSFVATGRGGKRKRGMIGQRPGPPQCIHFFYTRFGLKSNYTRIIPRPPRLIILEPRRRFTIGPFLENRAPKDTPLSEIIRPSPLTTLL